MLSDSEWLKLTIIATNSSDLHNIQFVWPVYNDSCCFEVMKMFKFNFGLRRGV